jgi:cytochrome c biogenesis protein CcmG, thiol:disulfide interchange protein DsbE
MAARKRSAVVTAARWLGLVAAAFIALVVLNVTASGPDLPDFRASGDPAELPVTGTLPIVELPQFEAMIVGARGRPIIVNVWGSWCAPCRAEMPLLQDAFETYGDRVVFLGVAGNDSRDGAQRFLRDLDVTYANTIDESGSILRALEVDAFPTTFVFDAEGTLVIKVEGGVSEQRLAGLLDDAVR